MSTQTLSSVAIDVVGQYHLAAQHLSQAWQAGIQRVAETIEQRVGGAVAQRELPFVDSNVKSSLLEAHRRVAGLVVQSLSAGSKAVDASNERIAEGLKAGIARLDSLYDSRARETVGVIGLPSAQVSLAVATAVAQGAKRLSERVAPVVADEVVVEEAAKPAGKRSRA